MDVLKGMSSSEWRTPSRHTRNTIIGGTGATLQRVVPSGQALEQILPSEDMCLAPTHAQLMPNACMGCHDSMRCVRGRGVYTQLHTLWRCGSAPSHALKSANMPSAFSSRILKVKSPP